MSKKIAFILFSLLMLFITSGCVKNCVPDDYENFTLYMDSPADGSIVNYSGQKTFTWHNNLGCKPEQYNLHISRQGAYGDMNMYLDGDETSKTIHNDYLTFPNQEYSWWVNAIDHDYDDNVIWATSPIPANYMTDGLCEANQLVAPNPIHPSNGEWKGAPNRVQIEWAYPGNCFPEYYHYQVAADPAFNVMITSGITDFFRTRVRVDSGNGGTVLQPSGHANISVPSCARVYWRVQARRGNQSGPYSETFRFSNAETFDCWQNEVSIDAALIQGRVFKDICPHTKPWIPEDAVVMAPCTSSNFGIHGDGNQSRGVGGDPGIYGVIVDLGAGPCPSTGMDTFPSLANGMYFFMVQAPGEYCVSVSKLTNPGLEDGIFTEPLTDQDVAQKTLIFGANDLEMHQNFGWDENDFIPLEFTPASLTKCRSGYSTKYPEVLYLEEGIPVPIVARNEENTWFLTKWGCWVSIATGTPEDGILPIHPLLPPPPSVEKPKDDGRPDPDPIDCSDYSDPDDCPYDHCKWESSPLGGVCVER